jgi:hypothetical protein
MINYGQHPNLPANLIKPETSPVPAVEDLLNQIASAQKLAKEEMTRSVIQQQIYSDKGRREEVFAVGEEVLLSTRNLTPLNMKNRPTKKLTEKYTGPFKVIERIGPVAYRLQLNDKLRVHNVFHVSLLKRFKDNPELFASRKETPPEPIEIDGETEYEVEKILDSRNRKSKNKVTREYLVKWKGYGDSDATWEPLKNLEHAEDLLRDYLLINHPEEGESVKDQ